MNRFLRKRFGHEIRSTATLQDHALQYHLEKLFRTLDVQSVLDVGANDGDFGRMLRREVGFEGLIVSFEPVPALAESLRVQAHSDPRWVVCDYALGSSNSRMDINVMKGSKFSSFLKPDNTVVEEFRDKNVVDHTETVAIRTLDSVLPSLREKRFLKNIFLKIDTQGYDLEVIRGAQKSLPEVVALQMEISLRPLYSGMPGYLEVLKDLNDLGFEVTGIFPVVRDALLRVIEVDCVALNGRLVDKL